MSYPFVTHHNPCCACNVRAEHPALRGVHLPPNAVQLDAPGVAHNVLDARIAHTIPVRPCRRSEAVPDLSDNLPPGPLVAVGGQMIVVSKGNRLV